MKNGLELAYEQVISEAKEGTVKSNLSPGANAAGELKKASQGGPEKAGIKKPAEGEAKINPGHRKIKTESRELSNMLPQSKFDMLFKKQIVEEEDTTEITGDESPLEKGGEGEFNDEEGDFPSQGGDDTAEEVDIATELRMVIDTLTELADKLGAYDEESDAGEGSAEEELGGEAGAEGGQEIAPEGLPEGVQAEAVQAKLKPFKNAVKKMQAKNNKVQSAFKASGKKASATGGPGKGAADGKLGAARKTNLGPKMSPKADVKGTMGKVGAGMFDNV
jgi:hypothetical protein